MLIRTLVSEILPRIDHGATEGTEKSRSFICPDAASGQMKGVSLPSAMGFE
jgi:hypothetical protein